MQGQGQDGNSRETPSLGLFLENIEMNPNDGHSSGNHGTVTPSILPGQGTGSGALQLDLNEPLQLTLDLSRTERSSGNKQIQTSGGSTCPIMTHSGSAGHVVEETINGEGLPTTGQSRLLCKRRAPQVSQPQNNALNIPTTARSSNNGSHLARPELSVAASSIQIRQTDNFQRNTRLRTIVSPRNPGPGNMSAWNSSNFNVQQATGHHHQLQPRQSIVGVPNPLQPPLPSEYWNGPTMLARGHSSFGAPSMITQSANIQPNMNLVNGNPSFLRNVSASSGIQFGPDMYTSPFSSMAEQTAQRIQYFLDLSEAGRMAHNYPASSNFSPTIRDYEFLMMNGYQGPSEFPQRFGAIGNDSRLSRTMVSETDAQRTRLISQLRNYLRLVRRTGGLQIEDARDMGRVFLQGMYALENDHDDMLLDVDHMYYEGLLDLGLGDQIGNGNAGLRVATIRAHMRRRRFLPISAEPTAEAEKCCICQEDYANGVELGKLDCGHDFHFNCIKRWLRRKNLCPICKKIGLAI